MLTLRGDKKMTFNSTYSCHDARQYSWEWYSITIMGMSMNMKYISVYNAAARGDSTQETMLDADFPIFQLLQR